MDTSDDVSKSSQKSGDDPTVIPASAWRPFERGPRNCIGQELANIEARVIVACAARRYQVEKVGIGEKALDENGNGVLDENGVFKVKSEMYSKHRVTSKPVDEMRVRASFVKR
jgi:hypothetical protein